MQISSEPEKEDENSRFDDGRTWEREITGIWQKKMSAAAAPKIAYACRALDFISLKSFI